MSVVTLFNAWLEEVRLNLNRNEFTTIELVYLKELFRKDTKSEEVNLCRMV